MSCGLTRTLSKTKYIKATFWKRIKHIFTKENKCKECLWCDYFFDCKSEYDWKHGGKDWIQISDTEYYYVGLPDKSYK